MIYNIQLSRYHMCDGYFDLFWLYSNYKTQKRINYTTFSSIVYPMALSYTFMFNNKRKYMYVHAIIYDSI